MRYVSLLISFFLVVFFFSDFELYPRREIVEKKELNRNRNNGLMLWKGKPFSGKAVVYGANGFVLEELFFVKGQKSGTQKKWFLNGRLSYLAHYDANKKEGKSFSWWKNGQMRSLSNFKSGKPDGDQMEWYPDGQLFKKLSLVNGKEEGLQQAWRKNGKLYSNYVVKNGRNYGLKRANLCFELKNENLVVDD